MSERMDRQGGWEDFDTIVVLKEESDVASRVPVFWDDEQQAACQRVQGSWQVDGRQGPGLLLVCSSLLVTLVLLPPPSLQEHCSKKGRSREFVLPQGLSPQASSFSNHSPAATTQPTQHQALHPFSILSTIETPLYVLVVLRARVCQSALSTALLIAWSNSLLDHSEITPSRICSSYARDSWSRGNPSRDWP